MSEKTSLGTWLTTAVVVAVVVAACVYSLDTPTRLVARMHGQVVSTHPADSKFPERLRVVVQADDGTVFTTTLGEKKYSPGVVPVVPKGTLVEVQVYESPTFGRRKYTASEQQ